MATKSERFPWTKDESWGLIDLMTESQQQSRPTPLVQRQNCPSSGQWGFVHQSPQSQGQRMLARVTIRIDCHRNSQP